MPWKRMLAVVTGEIEESLLARVEYMVEENRVLRNQLDKRLKLTDPERKVLAEKAVLLGKLMADTVTIVKPDTILKWHRRLVAKKFDGSRFRKKHGRPPVTPEIEELVPTMAKDNLYIFGPEELLDQKASLNTLDQPETQAIAQKQDAAYNGESGATLLVVDRSNGEMTEGYQLHTTPVFDGMVSAYNKLFIAMSDGSVVCLGDKGADIKTLSAETIETYNASSSVE